jgi:hypothetical protein
MGLESTTTIAGLVVTNPVASDPVGQADDHLRLLKNVLKTIFPGAGGVGFATPITATETELNYVDGVTSAIQTQLNTIGGNATTALANAATADGKAVDAQADATQALADAATADGKAVTALANAATADGKAVDAQADATSALSLAGNAATKANAARAWVYFDDDSLGTCTILESSSNVSTVTTGVDGVYTVNFSPALTDSIYAVFATCEHTSFRAAVCSSAGVNSCEIKTYDAAGALQNTNFVSVMVLSSD